MNSQLPLSDFLRRILPAENTQHESPLIISPAGLWFIVFFVRE